MANDPQAYLRGTMVMLHVWRWLCRGRMPSLLWVQGRGGLLGGPPH